MYCQPSNYNATLCAQASILPTPVAGPASQVLIKSGGASLSCGGTTAIIIGVGQASGSPVADGTAVTLTASGGTVSPTSVTTQGGNASATFTAGTTATTASVSANAGGISNSTSINITCAAGTAPSSVPASQPQQPPPYTGPATTSLPQPPGGLTLRPPNTGDAGLADPRLR